MFPARAVRRSEMARKKKVTLKARMRESAQRWKPLAVGQLLDEALERIEYLEEELFRNEG